MYAVENGPDSLDIELVLITLSPIKIIESELRHSNEINLFSAFV